MGKGDKDAAQPLFHSGSDQRSRRALRLARGPAQPTRVGGSTGRFEPKIFTEIKKTCQALSSLPSRAGGHSSGQGCSQRRLACPARVSVPNTSRGPSALPSALPHPPLCPGASLACMARVCSLASGFLAGVASGRPSEGERGESGCLVSCSVPVGLQVTVS